MADPFARKITEGVVKDEYTHLNYGQEWLKANFKARKDELFEANKANLPSSARCWKTWQLMLPSFTWRRKT